MEKKYLQYSQEIQVSVNDVDFCERLKPAAVMEYFQDIATEHAVVIGTGYAEMKLKNLVWVMSRMSYKLFRNPRIGEKLTIVTYPEQPKAAEAVRDYYIQDEAGDIIVSGSSKWCVLDYVTRRIQRCAPLFSFESSEYIPYPPFEDANLRIASFSAEEAKEGPYSYAVQLTELDRNFHMNNARYGDVLLNVCTVEHLKTHGFARVDVNFLSELLVGDCYEVYKALYEDCMVIEARKAGTDAVVFRARAEWVKD